MSQSRALFLKAVWYSFRSLQSNFVYSCLHTGAWHLLGLVWEVSYQAVPIHDRGAVPAGAQDAGLEHLWVIAAKRKHLSNAKAISFPAKKAPLHISSVSNAVTALLSRQSTPETGR